MKKEFELYMIQNLIGVCEIAENITDMKIVDSLTSFEDRGQLLQVDFDTYRSLEEVKDGFKMIEDSTHPYKLEYVVFRTNKDYNVKTVFIDMIK